MAGTGADAADLLVEFVPAGGDRGFYDKLRDYMYRLDDTVTCAKCRRRFEIPSHRALIFLEQDEDGLWNTYGMSLGKFDFVRDANGREQVLGFFLPGEVIGLAGLTDQQRGRSGRARKINAHRSGDPRGGLTAVVIGERHENLVSCNGDKLILLVPFELKSSAWVVHFNRLSSGTFLLLHHDDHHHRNDGRKYERNENRGDQK